MTARPAARAERADWLFRGIVALASGCMLFAASMPLWRTTREIALDRYHGRLPFAAWAALQVVPAMYNFENQVEVQTDADARPLYGVWLNHHVTRVVYEVGAWPPLDRGAGCYRFVLQSAYRGSKRTTTYRACRSPDKALYSVARIANAP